MMSPVISYDARIMRFFKTLELHNPPMAKTSSDVLLQLLDCRRRWGHQSAVNASRLATLVGGQAGMEPLMMIIYEYHKHSYIIVI